MFDKSLEINSSDTVILNSYGTALGAKGNYEKAFEMFDKSLEIDNNNLKTIFQYVLLLENKGRFEKAIELLEQIKTNIKLDKWEVDFIYFTLARLYYATKAKTLGDKCFEFILKDSDNRNRDLLKGAKDILRHSPYSKDAIKKLKKIAEYSNEYKQAIRIMFHNMSIEEYFNQFNHLIIDEVKFKETDELSSAIFHKILNQIFILKNRVREYIDLDKNFKNILEKIENISIQIDEKKLLMKKELSQIERGDYQKLTEQISKISHNIADIVINNLSKIKSDIDFILYDKSFKYSHELNLVLNQVSINLSTMESLKSINKSIKLENKTFKVKEIFKTFENNMYFRKTIIKLDIQNGEDNLYGDRPKIVEFLNELIENSIKYKKEKNIEIFITSSNIENPTIDKISYNGKFLFINYRNTEAKIEKEIKEKIFLPLYSSKKDSSGLGLFIIKKTLEFMQGYIIENGKDEVNFEIYIPYKQEFKNAR